MADVEAIRPLPALRFFKIGVDLDMVGGRDPAAKRVRAEPVREAPAPDALERARHRRGARAPVRPAAAAGAVRGAGGAARVHRSRAAAKAAELQETGQMRRFAAVLYHRSAGFTANGMGVWKVPDERVDEMGQLMAAYRGVSHCYQRPTYPDWPYNLFSMTHGRDRARVRGGARRDRRGDGPRRADRPLLDEGVEEDAARLLQPGRRGVGAPARARAPARA